MRAGALAGKADYETQASDRTRRHDKSGSGSVDAHPRDTNLNHFFVSGLLLYEGLYRTEMSHLSHIRDYPEIHEDI